jgi:predicted class III extradiol MEMO1 family dioxygenase
MLGTLTLPNVACAYKHIEAASYSRVFLFGPSHMPTSLALPTAVVYETPLSLIDTETVGVLEATQASVEGNDKGGGERAQFRNESPLHLQGIRWPLLQTSPCDHRATEH